MKRWIVAVLVCSNVVSLAFSLLAFVRAYAGDRSEFDLPRCVSSVAAVRSVFGGSGAQSNATAFLCGGGRLLTCFHAVSRETASGEFVLAGSVDVRFPDEAGWRSASILAYDAGTDVALLVARDDGRPALGPFSTGADYGDDCYFVGNTGGFGISVSKGTVSIPSVLVEIDGTPRPYLQSNVDIYPGSSGGCLLDARGAVLGMAAFRLKDATGTPVAGYGYFVPSPVLVEFLQDVS